MVLIGHDSGNDFISIKLQLGFNMRQPRHGFDQIATMDTRVVLSSNLNPIPVNAQSLWGLIDSYNLARISTESKYINQKGKEKLNVEHFFADAHNAANAATKTLEVALAQIFDEKVLSISSPMHTSQQSGQKHHLDLGYFDFDNPVATRDTALLAVGVEKHKATNQLSEIGVAYLDLRRARNVALGI